MTSRGGNMYILPKILKTGGIVFAIGATAFSVYWNSRATSQRVDNTADLLAAVQQEQNLIEEKPIYEIKSQAEYSVKNILENKELKKTLKNFIGKNSGRHGNDLALLKQVSSLIVRQMEEDGFIEKEQMEVALEKLKNMSESDITPQMNKAIDKTRESAFDNTEMWLVIGFGCAIGSLFYIEGSFVEDRYM